MKKFEIHEDQVQSLMRYLQSRPYAEVYQGIGMLTRLKEIVEEKPKDEKKSNKKQ